MCMATFVPANIDIPWQGLENGAVFNDDGHGWAVASEKGLQVGKSMSYDLAALTLASAREEHGPDSLVLFHSRFATHGTTDEFNVHPFYVGAGDGDVETDTVMVHNGIMPLKWHPYAGDVRSDTRVFGDTVAIDYVDLGEGGTGIPSRRGGKQLGSMIGPGNKLVFLTAKDGKPRVRIINAHQGTFSDGCWYSNTGFMTSSYANYGWGSSSYSSSSKSADWGSTASTSSKSTSDYACPFCGNKDTVDQVAGICEACELCLDCNDWLGDCQCYATTSQQVELWPSDASPLNPKFEVAE